MAEPATLLVDESGNEHLRGPFAPVDDELDVADLPVRGTLPTNLAGTYVRNGPNPQFAPLGSYTYPFDGDGMIHALRFEGGRVRYRNRWVVTRGLAAERHAGHALYGGLLTPVPLDKKAIGPNGDPSPFKNWSNTSVVRHAGRILSLYEGGLPYELTDGFGTVGEYDFGGALPGSMTAHPKVDPVWEELCWFRYDIDPPYLIYGVVDPRGQVSRTVQVDIPRPVMMHDFGVTDQHVVFFDCPAIFDPAAAASGHPLLQWKPEHGTRIGVMPRDGGTGDVRWFPVENRFVMHVMNAHTDGDLVIVDYVHRDEVPFLDAPVADNVPRLYRTTIDLERGITNDEMLDTRPVEFPRIDDRRSGLSFRFGYVCAVTHGGNGPKGADFDALVRYDFVSDRAVEHRFPEGIVVGEPVFAPNPDGMSEEDGWVLALTYDTTRDESELVVIDAADFDGEPVARVPMPRRIPAGLHGAWLPAD